MTQWYVKDLSQLTGVSKQTLHHYDRIDLLKPSIRLDNGYRVYSEKDLLKLQQIIALKFFGFNLKQIKSLLSHHTNPLQHFNKQVFVLEQKAAALLDSAKTLKHILSTVTDNTSIPWEIILQLIEVYQMTKHLEHAWVKDIYTPDELKQYAEFEYELKANKTPEQRLEFENSWKALVTEIQQNLAQDPNSSIGIALGKKTMDWVNQVYGRKYAHLRTKKFEQGFGEGKGLEEVGLTKDIVNWMDAAMNAYWFDRCYRILDQIEKIPETTLSVLWNNMLLDMYGDETARYNHVFELALKDKKISPAAKSWLTSKLPAKK